VSTTTILPQLEARITRCRRCPELRDYCAEVGRTKRRAYADEAYWAKPVPGFGDVRAKLLIVGLAPAAHGANRTGRMFTGDRSGDFLYAALHRAGLATQPTSTARDDGLALEGVRIAAALRCAPPANKPTTEQLERCRPWLLEELCLLQPRAILALGKIGWDATLVTIRAMIERGATGIEIGRPKPVFGHDVTADLGRITLVGAYHPSQQNTFTGKLTPKMLDDAIATAWRAANEAPSSSRCTR